MRKKDQLKAVFEKAYLDYHQHPFRQQDPVSFAHQFTSREDQEVVAFISALLAYGNVKTILASVKKVLLVLGDSPANTIRAGRFRDQFSTFRHRFTTGEDIEILCFWLRNALESSGSLEAYFMGEQPPKGETPQDTKARLASFARRFSAQPLPAHLTKVRPKRERNLKYLISNPDRGSACKRLNMFLRWMVRPSDGIDLGLWTQLSPKDLMLPIDTHLLQTLRLLKWTRAKHATWRVTEAATEKLRELSPEDPIRYDFALCHLSMAGMTIRRYESLE